MTLTYNGIAIEAKVAKKFEMKFGEYTLVVIHLVPR